LPQPLISIFVLMRPDVPHLLRDPAFERLERQMDDLVQRLLRRPTPASYQRAWAPRIDVYDADDAFIAVVELADVDASQVTIEIAGEEVAITGHRLPPSAPQGADCLQLEIPFGPFERRLLLPVAVDASRASADFKDGMLTVRLPKSPQEPKRVQVDIQRPR
jgi:HSP20 family protein